MLSHINHATEAEFLPSRHFPLGSPSLEETRTVKELRTGLTHVHIQRGSWGPNGPPELTLKFQSDKPEVLEKACRAFERIGLKVNQKTFLQGNDGKPNSIITAGEFSTRKEALRAFEKAPVGSEIERLISEKDKRELYVIDLVVIDPKKYRGKIITAWSENIWRASPLELALKHNAVVATNGAWFEYSIDDVAGIPSGISIVNGLWHHEHHHQRQPGSIIAIVENSLPKYNPNSKREGIVFIENLPEKGITLTIGQDPPPLPVLKYGNGKSVTINGIDRMPKRNANELVAIRESIFWNSQFSHGHPEDWLTVRMINEESSGIKLFLLATGDKRLILEASTLESLRLDLSIPGRPGLSALFSYNILIENGKRTGIIDRNNATARTSIGSDHSGKIYLISTPSNTSLYDSNGASLADLQNIGEYLDLVNLANMDGGPRSSSMVIEGKALGDPHFKIYDDDRRVSDSILVIDED